MKKYYTIGEFAVLIGKSKNTLREWDKTGKLKPHHITEGKHRLYSEAQLREVLEQDWNSHSSSSRKKVAAYCRCSEISTEEELEFKLNVLKVYLGSKEYDFKVYKERKNELTIKNTELERLLEDILNGEYEKLVVQSKEDLSIVHINMIELICKHSNTELEIVDKNAMINSSKFLKEALDFTDSMKA